MWGPSEYARNTSLDQEAKLLVRAASKGSIFQGQHLIVKEYNLVINRDNPERPSVAKQLEEKRVLTDTCIYTLTARNRMSYI